MAWLRRAPRIELLAPRAMRAGETHTLRVVLDARRPVEVEQVEATLEATTRVRYSAESATTTHPFRAGARFGAGTLADSVRAHPFRRGSRLSGPTALPEGRTELPFQVSLPPSVPPSYAGVSVSTTWTVRVTVTIPWWPDPTSVFEVHVAPAPGPTDDAPVVASTTPEGPRADEPFLECSLVSRRVVAGGFVDGSLALGNAEVLSYRDASVALVGYEVPDVRNAYEREAWRHDYPLDVTPSRAGHALPFRLAVPQDLPPSWSGDWRLRWAFEMRAGLGWMRRLEGSVPVVVVSPEDAKPPAERFAPPAVGSERLQEVWREVGEAVGLTAAVDALHGTVGLVHVAVRRVHEGRAGIFLVGELRYPSLALGLSIQPWRRFADMLATTVPLGDAGFDDRHRLSARDVDGATSLCRRLLEPFGRFDRIVMSDEAARFALRDAGHRVEPLRRFSLDVLGVAKTLSATRGPYR